MLLEWLSLFLEIILSLDLLLLLECFFCFGIGFCNFELFEEGNVLGFEIFCFFKGVFFVVVIWIREVGLDFFIFLMLEDLGVGVGGVGCFRVFRCCWGLGFLKINVVYKFE